MGVTYYKWPEAPNTVCIVDGNGYEWEGEEVRGVAPKHRSPAEFFMLRNLIRPDEVESILEHAAQALQRSLDRGGSMSPDSVDKHPTMWHYFIEHGQYTGELDSLLQPIVTERLEPYARQRYGPGALVCHCFVRRYLPEERRRLGAHFDHHAYVTAVVGLNPDAFEGGLFVQGEARSDRAFVGLGPGDVLFHQYDLHHGVEVASGRRYSLVFWLMDSRESCVTGAVPWYQRSAEAGDSDAQHLWASCLASGEHSGRSGPDVAAAVPWFERSVAQKNVEAMNVYAALLWGDEAWRDDRRALALWKEASDLGYAKARGNLGSILCTGMDGRVPRDYAEGMRLLRSAADMEDYDAMLKLASHLRRAGDPEALRWLKCCAEMGNPDACLMMADMHITGELGANREPSSIFRYTRWASNLGCAKATTQLGAFHARGDFGLVADVPRAVALWRKAAACGNPDAELNLALCLLRGEGGLRQDAGRALRLCESAAAQGQLTALQMQLEFRQAAAQDAQAEDATEAIGGIGTPGVTGLSDSPGHADVGARTRLVGSQSESGSRLNGTTGTLVSLDQSGKQRRDLLDAAACSNKPLDVEKIVRLRVDQDGLDSIMWEAVD